MEEKKDEYPMSNTQYTMMKEGISPGNFFIDIQLQLT
jgi:hypothetical protein